MRTKGLGLRADDRALVRLVDDPTSLFYISAGPLFAILLGMALTPVRHATPASNFTFVFLALTIAVARLGGRWPALATALCSSLSLDFFLTEPYRRLAIADKHDVIAFVGLTVCGLLAAVLGRSRAEESDRLVHEALRVGARASATARQALFDVASIVGILLARDDRDAPAGH